ncbi:SEL1-like repeat protein [uncultured Planktosalinus sp.]|uniref:SEL1-like repeat protein n=1 Tax=uncultured Planktosalinus sp. TaxID=1810935 RepID=UPI0030D96618
MKPKPLFLVCTILICTTTLFAQEFTRFKLSHESKWGFKDAAGEVVVPPVYQVVGEFSEGLAPVGNPDERGTMRWGFVDVQGDTIVDFQYYFAGKFSEGLARVRGKNYEFGYINPDGKVIIDFQYQEAGDFKNGLAAVGNGGHLEKGQMVNIKWGYVNPENRLMIPHQFDAAYQFGDKNLAVVKKGKNWGMIDRNGATVIPFKYDPFFERANNTIIVSKNGKKGAYDFSGKSLVPVKYYEMHPYSDGLAAVKDKEKFGEWGFVDRRGKLVIKPTYKEVHPFSEGVAAVRSVVGWNFIDREGNPLFSKTFYMIGSFSEGLAPVMFNNNSHKTWHFIDKTGAPQLEINGYISVEPFQNGLARVGKNVGNRDIRYGFIDRSGSEVIPPVYTGATYLSDGTFRVYQGTRFMILGPDGTPNRKAAIAANEKILKEHPSKDEGATEYQKGREAFNLKNFHEAFKQWRIAALHDHAEAAYGVGILYHNGKGSPLNYAESEYWYLKAAELGHPKAMFNAGIILLSGNNGPKDEAGAMEWFKKAGEAGENIAYIKLAQMHLNRPSGKKDIEAAVRYYQKAGNADAYFALAGLISDGTWNTVPAKEAANYYVRAADMGHAHAAYTYGMMKYNGSNGVPKSEAGAHYYFVKAAKSNHSGATYMLAQYYEKGIYVGKNEKEAEALYKKAASWGHPEATAWVNTKYPQQQTFTSSAQPLDWSFSKTPNAGSGFNEADHNWKLNNELRNYKNYLDTKFGKTKSIW